MPNPDFVGLVKKKIIAVVVLILVAYIGAGIAFREYRMNPENKYHSNYLRSAPRPPSNGKASKEAWEQLSSELFRDPNLTEIFFMPAERLFRVIGY